MQPGVIEAVQHSIEKSTAVPHCTESNAQQERGTSDSLSASEAAKLISYRQDALHDSQSSSESEAARLNRAKQRVGPI